VARHFGIRYCRRTPPILLLCARYVCFLASGASNAGGITRRRSLSARRGTGTLCVPVISEHPTQGVRAEAADAIMQTEGAYLLAQRENGRARYCGMDKFADQEAQWLDRIGRDERVHKAAHFLALRQNGRTEYCRTDNSLTKPPK